MRPQCVKCLAQTFDRGQTRDETVLAPAARCVAAWAPPSSRIAIEARRPFPSCPPLPPHMLVLRGAGLLGTSPSPSTTLAGMADGEARSKFGVLRTRPDSRSETHLDSRRALTCTGVLLLHFALGLSTGSGPAAAQPFTARSCPSCAPVTASEVLCGASAHPMLAACTAVGSFESMLRGSRSSAESPSHDSASRDSKIFGSTLRPKFGGGTMSASVGG